MKLHLLTPASLEQATGRYAGRCAACEQPLEPSDRVVHMYGEKFHHQCAFYRDASATSPQTAGAAG